ncbi:MAG: hypothetical protein HOW73_25405 [Polyangiaceae bacterium]|nr:hypothetical protein [Polyangiaceae bacterium]
MFPRRVFVGSVLGLASATVGAGCVSTRGPSVPQGAIAPSFTLKSHLGTEVSLDSLTAQGPAVLVFYRGFW